jgi:hypothetical protein
MSPFTVADTSITVPPFYIRRYVHRNATVFRCRYVHHNATILPSVIRRSQFHQFTFGGTRITMPPFYLHRYVHHNATFFKMVAL